MAGAKKEKKHIVVFQDEEGNVLKTSFVSHEEEAIPPELPQKKGESEHHEIKFQGWDQDISCVQGNLVVKAVYKEVPKEYLVMYFHESGKLLGTESVPYGQAASQPYHPQKPKTAEHYYIFKGWNNDLSHIEKDTMAKAVFEERKRSFTVAFFHEDGTVLKKEEVLYGQEAHAPQSPVKQQDAVWHYIFEGWDKTFDSVKENIEVHAVFSSVYNEYNVCIYERLSEGNNGLQDEQLEEKIKEKQYHYGDLIEYPKLKKKGYTLRWDNHPETVTQDEEIHASWEFSNPAGRVAEVEGNRYEIINPSIKNGSVRLLYYIEDTSQIQIPAQVKIGDYYYFIERVAPRAFCDCRKMRSLTLPDCIRVLEKEALAGCRRLEKITLGKSRNSRLHSIEKEVFCENEHLKTIYLKGRNLQKVYADTFARLKNEVEVHVRPESLANVSRMLQKGVRTGKVRIRAGK